LTVDAQHHLALSRRAVRVAVTDEMLDAQRDMLAALAVSNNAAPCNGGRHV